MYNANAQTACNSLGSDRAIGSQVAATPCVAESLERTTKALLELNARLLTLGERIHGSAVPTKASNCDATGAASLRDAAARVADLADMAIAAFERVNGGITGQ